MQRPRQTPTLGGRIARLAGRPPSGPTPPVRKRRVPRREIERRRQRMVRWGMAIAGALVVLVLAGGALNEFVLKPNAVLASVGGVDIHRSDYWKARAVDLLEQANQYQQYAALVGPDQQGQYQQIAQSTLAQIPRVWGSTDVDQTSLDKMVDDQVYLQGLPSLGLELTDAEVDAYALNRFAPPGAPLQTPPPTPTLIPARAAMATETAVAFAASPTPIPGTPGATPLATLPPPPALGSSGATPVAAVPATPDASPAATPAGSPIPGAARAAAREATPAGTPNPDEARATAEAGFSRFEQSFFSTAHLSRDDYLRLVARPELAREKVRQAIAAKVGQSAEQVHAAHILVQTKDLADELEKRLAAGEDFATIARQTSTDQETAGNGGDLGWFAREEVAKPLADAAFALQPGQVSPPVESEFGWHVVKVLERQNDRPLTDAQINKIEQARVDDWLAQQRAALRISSSLGPTPTPEPGAFQPPANAPPPPSPTPLPEGTPSGTPGATPSAAASPEAGAPPAGALATP